MKSPGFRTRLFAILSLFALVPALTLTLAWGVLATRTLPLVSGSAAWERLAESGRKAVDAVENAPLTGAQRGALRAHELELEESVTQARRFRFLATRLVPVVVVSALVAWKSISLPTQPIAGRLVLVVSKAKAPAVSPALA